MCIILLTRYIGMYQRIFSLYIYYGIVWVQSFSVYYFIGGGILSSTNGKRHGYMVIGYMCNILR